MHSKFHKIKRLTVIGDLHLDSTGFPNNLDKIVKYLSVLKSGGENDAYVILGDISSQKWLYDHLTCLSEAFSNQYVFFVLGNHDFYSAYIQAAEVHAKNACKNTPNLIWLNQEKEPIELNNGKITLTGVDGWADGIGATGYIADHAHISDYRQKGINALDFALNRAKNSATLIEGKWNKTGRETIVATHIPTWLKASLPIPSIIPDESIRPWFVNRPLGESIDNLSIRYGTVKTYVFSAHTHADGMYTSTGFSSITQYVLGSEYGQYPSIKVFDLNNGGIRSYFGKPEVEIHTSDTRIFWEF